VVFFGLRRLIAHIASLFCDRNAFIMARPIASAICGGLLSPTASIRVWRAQYIKTFLATPAIHRDILTMIAKPNTFRFRALEP